MSAKIEGIVRKIDIAKVDAALLIKTLEGLDIKVVGKVDPTTKEGVTGLVNQYADWCLAKSKDKDFNKQRTKPDGVNFIQCPVCKAFSLDELNECPVCGSEEEGSTPSIEIVKNKTRDSTLPKPIRNVVVATDVKLVGTVADLDAAVVEIKKCRDKALTSYYELGEALLPVYTKALYKARVDPKTKLPKYRTFAQFCQAELGISCETAMRIMAIVSGTSPEHLNELGFTKMVLLIRLPKEELPKMLERAKTLSTRELDEEIRKLCPGARREPIASNGAAPHRRDTSAATAARTATVESKVRPESVANEKEGRLTVAVLPGKREIKLSRKGTTMVGFEEFENAIVATYTIKGNSMVIEFKRA